MRDKETLMESIELQIGGFCKVFQLQGTQSSFSQMLILYNKTFFFLHFKLVHFVRLKQEYSL